MYKQIRLNSEALRRSAGFCTIALIISLGAMSSVEAAEWRFEPVLRIAGDVDDNPFLSTRTDDVETESGYIAEVSAKIAYASDKSDFFITPTFRSSDYGTGSELNADDQFLNMNFTHNTEYTNFRIRGSYEREAVRTAERADTDFDVEDPDDILEDDSGRVLVQGRRERARIAPSFLYRLSGVSALGLQVDYTDVRYEDTFAGLLTDYTDGRVSASYRRAWSPRNTAIVTATHRIFKPDRAGDEVNGAGLMVGVDRQISETSRFRLTVGFENTEVGDNTSEVNPVGDVSFVQRGKTTTLLVQYRRSIIDRLIARQPNDTNSIV